MVSLMNLLNRREDYFSLLKGKRSDTIMPLKTTEVEEAILKLLESKGKDKGRVKFNLMTN